MRTKLRSKVTLFFIVCAALLAFGGTAMALVTDTSGNTSGTTAPEPTIQSDQADYPPGGLVTLTGSNWQPGESVHINVNDTYGASWSRNVDVTADASGQITDSFNLPDWFVSDYDVTATGSQSGTATTTFTDSIPQTVTVSPLIQTVTQGGSASYTVDVRMGGNTTNCTVTLNAQPLPAGTTASFSGGNTITTNQNFTKTLTVNTTATTPANPGGYPLIVQATSQASSCQNAQVVLSNPFRLVVNSANQPPTANANGPYDVNEGGSVQLNGSGSDPDPGDTLTYAWDLDNNGSFETTGQTPNFSAANIDGPATRTVVLRATDSKGATATSSATVNVKNVAPTVTLSGAATADEGDTKTYTYTVSDPGNDTYTAEENCGTNGTRTDTAAADSFDCTFPDGPATTDVTVKVTDSDGAADTDNQVVTVTVDNVAPVVELTGDATANEGDTKTYTYTVSDPGDDPPTITEECGTGGNYTDTAASNSFECTFPDGPASSTVKVTADDGDPTNNIGSDEIAVQVNNVKPTISDLTTTGSGAACIGSNNVVTLSFSFTDPGVDTQNGTINWGDGTTTEFNGSTPPSPVSVTQTHSYSAGNYTITVTAKDSDLAEADPKSTTGTQNVSLLYKVSELQDPVNRPPMTMSVFKHGSTIPLKVIITDCNNQPVNGLVPKISFTKVNPATPSIGVNEGLSTQPNDTNFLMRDAGNGQYIYNLNTKSLADGDATYNATITDSKVPATYGPKVSQNFGLRSK
jgi:hypothetical protein